MSVPNLLVGKAMSWNLVAGPRAGLGLLGRGRALPEYSSGPRVWVSQSLCWPARGQELSYLVPGAGSDLLVGRLGLQALGLPGFCM